MIHCLSYNSRQNLELILIFPNKTFNVLTFQYLTMQAKSRKKSKYFVDVIDFA